MILDGYDMNHVRSEIERSEHELLRAMHKLEKQFVIDNFDNVLGVTWFMELCNDATLRSGFPATTPLIEEIYISAPEHFKSHPKIYDFMKRVDDAMFGNMPQGKMTEDVMPSNREVDPNVHNANY